jgi:signal transduction histidine kinase
MIGVGLVIANRRPRNVIAWILLLQALLIGLSAVADSWAGVALLEHPGSLPAGRLAAAWSLVWWPLLYAGPAAIAFLFPDGTLPSRRWRPVAVGSAGLFVLALLAMITTTGPMDEPYQKFTSPIAVAGIPDAVRVVCIVILAFALVASAAAIVTRFRRADGIERLQLKWLAWAGALIPMTLLVCWSEALIFGGVGTVTGVWVGAMLAAIPIAVGLAVTRYRLYEIDRLINRTLVYGALTGLLAATFTVVTLLVGVAAGQGSPLATAAATLAVALLFSPARRRVQVWVDRRFSRARYDALRRITTFLDALRDGHAAPESTATVLADALRDPSLELRYWLPSSSIYVDASGQPARERPDDERARTEVTRGGAPLGLLLHDPRLLESRDLLDSAVSAAGLAIEIARLRVEVNRQLAEVEESRARLVTAGYEERRRLERDLHDGAQQRLVSIGLSLRHVQHELADESDATLRAQLDDTVAEVAAAIDDLRRIARGVRPPGLDEGLATALRDLAARSPLDVTVELEGIADLDPDVATAAWYVASEALTNAAKHAPGAHVRLVAQPTADNGVRISVEDDGDGGATMRTGGGLAGLRDRVGAHGGSLELQSPAGGGTRVAAELPCA